MKRALFLAGVAAATTLRVGPARADEPAAASDMSYDDPAVHYTAPAGWLRIPTPPGQDDGSVLVGFAKQFDPNDVRQITLTIKVDDSTLEGIDRNHEIELRSAGNGSVFVTKRTLTALANGMPAWWLSVNSGEDLKRARLYEWVVSDTRRAITLGYAGRDGYFEEKEAIAALASLSVVVFPRGRQ